MHTTFFHPQSNSVIEGLNRTFLIMPTKSIDKKQAQWSYFLPFVLMTYRSSVHESTGYTINFLALSHQFFFLLHVMYPSPETNKPTDVNKHVMQKQAVFHTIFKPN